MKSPVSWCGPVLCCVSLRDVGVSLPFSRPILRITQTPFIQRHATLDHAIRVPVKARTIVEQCQRPTAPGHGKLFVYLLTSTFAVLYDKRETASKSFLVACRHHPDSGGMGSSISLREGGIKPMANVSTIVHGGVQVCCGANSEVQNKNQ